MFYFCCPRKCKALLLIKAAAFRVAKKLYARLEIAGPATESPESLAKPENHNECRRPVEGAGTELAI
jgi:hypothetical protein